MALEYLSGLGVTAQHRERPLAVDTAAAGSIADIRTYEAGRPSAHLAPREGDARVLQSDDFEIGYRPAPIDGVSVSVDQHLDKYRRGGD